MAETYSIGITGAPADNEMAVFRGQTTQAIDVADSVCGSIGDMQGAMSLNTPWLGRNPDGSQSWYTFDAERSIPGGVLYVKKLY